jgi:hypothetical protein
MPRISYVEKRFSTTTMATIEHADGICRQYAAQGLTLTLRQLYYRFVAGGLIPNRDTEYKRLGTILNDARLAGLIDWHHMEDRTRNLRALSHWDTPSEMIDSAAASYRIDKWARQPEYLEVWIEKDALVGVIRGIATTHDVPYFSCRGYTSQSEIWAAAQRHIRHMKRGQRVTILHLGDHDPSGIDMTRDITDRLALFCESHGYDAPTVQRLALNWDQIQQYAPPPNPAKLTDSRAYGYISRYGNDSWELDALEPTVITALINDAITAHRDEYLWDIAADREATERAQLQRIAEQWDAITDYLGEV